MGARHSKEKIVTAPDTKVPDGTTLTDRVSVGRSGREWHLPFEAKLDRKSASPRSSGVQLSSFQGEDSIVRMTCEFLRQHATETYRNLYHNLTLYHPTHPVYPESQRAAREQITPIPPSSASAERPPTHGHKIQRRAPFSIEVPEIGPDHWVYKRHSNIGHYCSPKSGKRDELIASEATQDVGCIRHYLQCYQTLAAEVRGRNLWEATRHAAVRDPYLTCMELCVGELQVPSHFLSLVHYGMGIHMMYERSMPWDKKEFPRNSPKELPSALRQSFKSLARLYREDFCSS